jgi:GntR family transcriptional regulator
MLLHVDPRAPEPLFEQVVLQVKGAIARGELRGGDRLPSVRELARELRINPNTVARAYRELERADVIATRRGAGCFVKDGASALKDSERARLLGELLSKAVTEGYHLGFDAAEIRSALDEHLAEVHFPARSDREKTR